MVATAERPWRALSIAAVCVAIASVVAPDMPVRAQTTPGDTGAIGKRPVYQGIDDRLEAEDVRAPQHLGQAQWEQLQVTLAATAILVPKNFLIAEGDGFRITPRPYTVVVDGSQLDVCPDQKFARQQRVGPCGTCCTAFLVGRPRQAVTAAHCIPPAPGGGADADALRLLFGFRLAGGQLPVRFSREQVVAIASIRLPQVPRKSTATDFAVLELERDATRNGAPLTPLQAAPAGDGSVGAGAGIVGYPEGLAQKASVNQRGTKGTVTEADGSQLRVVVDAFAGNSGAPVISLSRPDRVLGFVVSGHTDHSTYQGANCARYAQYTIDDVIRGERANRMTVLDGFLR